MVEMTQAENNRIRDECILNGHRIEHIHEIWERNHDKRLYFAKDSTYDRTAPCKSVYHCLRERHKVQKSLRRSQFSEWIRTIWISHGDDVTIRMLNCTHQIHVSICMYYHGPHGLGVRWYCLSPWCRSTYFPTASRDIVLRYPTAAVKPTYYFARCDKRDPIQDPTSHALFYWGRNDRVLPRVKKTGRLVGNSGAKWANWECECGWCGWEGSPSPVFVSMTWSVVSEESRMIVRGLSEWKGSVWEGGKASEVNRGTTWSGKIHNP